MTALARWLSGLEGWRRAVAAGSAGLAALLGFAPFQLWPILFVSFGALVFLLDGCHRQGTGRARLLCAAVTGFWFGFGYFLGALYWTGEAFLVEPLRHAWLLPFAMTLLPAGMALFFAAAATLAMTMWLPGPGRAIALAIAFGLAEYARGHVLTGLPWNLIGYGLTGPLPFMQLASLFGVYALSFLAVLVFTGPAAIVAPQPSLAAPRSAAAIAVAALLLLGGGYVWGQQRLRAETALTDLQVRIVQANIDQANKWRPENSVEIFNDYLSLTKRAGIADVDLVVWPETAVPFLLADSPDALEAIGNVLHDGAALLVGSARVVDERNEDETLIATRIYNSVLAVDDGGAVVGHYDKIHLVPFGEYLPFQDFMESLGLMQLTGIRGGFTPGSGPRSMVIPGLPAFSALICYEIIFPDDITSPGVRPAWLLNLTNDAWFGNSAGPYQHFHQARVRAVEQGLPLVRAANTGISAMIDPYGRILAEIALGDTGTVDATLPRGTEGTVYARLNGIIELSVLGLLLAGWTACLMLLSKRRAVTGAAMWCA